MPAAQLPKNEDVRLADLASYGILDTLADQVYDDLTNLAAYICTTPIALISLIDADRQWFKSKVGIAVAQTPRAYAFCAHAILEPHKVLVVKDATQDKRFADSPLVTGEPLIRFYAGAPLIMQSGEALGTLCVIDCVPRTLSDEQIGMLAALSRQVMASLELQRTAKISREERAMLKDAQRIGRIGSWDWDARTGTVAWSDESYCIFGLDQNGRIPDYREYLNLYTAESARRLESALMKCIQSGEQCELDLERVRAGGLRQWITVRCKIKLDENGKLMGLSGTTQDITERKLAEDALRINEASERAILDNLPYLVWLKDTEGRYINVNKKYVENLGLHDASQIAGKTDFDLWPLELAEKYRADDAEVMTTRQQMLTEDPSLAGDRIHWTETIKTPIVDNQGNLLGTTGFARDITQRKQAEKILLDSRDYLKEMVDKTTLELKQVQENYEEANTTLKIVLKHKEKDQSEAQESLAHKVRQEVAPFLSKLKLDARQPRQIRLLEALDANLQQLVSSFGHASPIPNLLYQLLTPIEIQVASMVREGASTKAIAETLSLSPETINVHRKHIRRKLGLKSKSANLHCYLRSLLAKHE